VGGTTTFDVVFDATSLIQVGDYTADLDFSGNFVNMVPTMPLTMHLDCPTCAFLDGSITDSVTGLPLASTVQITDTNGFDITFTDVSTYSLAIPAGVYNVTASSSGYFSETASVTLSAGVTTTQDFALVPIFGLLVEDPSLFDVTVGLGYSQTWPL
jgi:hypothetical protein